ncbi:MAG TPA: TetR/AcrR family transcriptional regulator [Candidatus Anammoximicrobium sp.]|nr:TetR/AcrR family transcriptional regulator [Candidatus Anammoximicrobium sp.]
MSTERPSSERILQAAVRLFLEQCVRKTSAEEVAFQAGVTRVTVYRYFTDKEGLVRAVCQRIGAVFQRAAEGSRSGSIDEIVACLNRLGWELSELGSGNMFALFDEVHRLYPDVYEEFRQTREAAIDTILEQALAAARRDGALRKGLNQEVVRALFVSGVVRLIETPSLISANVPAEDIVSTVTMIFQHGILKEKSTG